MFFYRVSLCGNESYDPRVLVHENEFTEEEFSSLIDRIVLQVVPDLITQKHADRVYWYTREIEEEDSLANARRILGDTKEAHLQRTHQKAKEPQELYLYSVFDKVAAILVEEYKFSYLKYAVVIERAEYEVVGIIPPII